MRFGNLVFTLTAIIFFTSCEKEYKYSSIPETNVFKDSSLLIKSITANFNNGEMVLTENYTYDTALHQTTLTYTNYSSINNDLGDYTTAQITLSYNSQGLLTNVQRTVPTGMGLTADEYLAVAQIDYDNAGVIKSLYVESAAGSSYTIPFTKTTQSNGYRLDWKDIYSNSNGGADTLFQWAYFDSKGNCTRNYEGYTDWSTNSGYFSVDSTLYDSKYNVSKVYNHTHIVNSNVLLLDTTILDINFTDRSSNGNNLYAQRQLLLNGVAQLPYRNIQYMLYGLMGIFSFITQDEIYELKTYPYKEMSAFLWNDGKFYTQSSAAQLDLKNRITSIKTYWRDDAFYPTQFSVSYYKN